MVNDHSQTRWMKPLSEKSYFENKIVRSPHANILQTCIQVKYFKFNFNAWKYFKNIQMLNNFICRNKLNNYERCLSVFELVDLQIEKKVKTFQQLLDLDSTAN